VLTKLYRQPLLAYLQIPTPDGTLVAKDYLIMKSTLALFATLAAMITVVSVGFAPAALAAESGVKCSILPAKFCETATKKASGDPNSKNDAVFMILEWAIGILTAGAGIVAIGAFVYAGLMYASADSKAEQVQKAKDIMKQAVIGLVAFALFATVLLWLIPGGVF